MDPACHSASGETEHQMVDHSQAITSKRKISLQKTSTYCKIGLIVYGLYQHHVLECYLCDIAFVRNIGPIINLYAYFKFFLNSFLTYYSKPMFYYYFLPKICPEMLC
jgi:hypothetical protein